MVRYFPADYMRYIEPFAGSACIYFKLAPRRAVIGDANPLLIDFYSVAVREPEKVYKKFFSIKRDAPTYYAIRDRYQRERNALRRAAYFLYLNRNCFNGIFRVNRSGFFNVPFSCSRVAPYPEEEDFIRSLRGLSRAKLICSDFDRLCRTEVKAGDFVYLDPPYYVPTSRVFGEYTATDFREEDLKRLKLLLAEIDRRGASFLLSFPQCEFTQSLPKRWHRREISVTRTVSASAQARRPSREVLVFNYSERDVRA